MKNIQFLVISILVMLITIGKAIAAANFKPDVKKTFVIEYQSTSKSDVFDGEMIIHTAEHLDKKSGVIRAKDGVIRFKGEFSGKYAVITCGRFFDIPNNNFGIGRETNYLINAGDSVRILFNPNKSKYSPLSVISVSGKGSQRFKTQLDLENISPDFQNNIPELGLLRFSEDFKIAKNRLGKQLVFLNKNKANFTPNQFKILKTMLTARTYEPAIYQMLGIYSPIKKVEAEGIRQLYVNKLLPELKYLKPLDLYACSPDYLEFIKSKERFEIKNKLKQDTSKRLFDVYVTEYSGKIRDQLITSYIAGNFSQADKLVPGLTDQYYKEALLIIKNKEFNDLIRQKYLAYGTNVPAYDFNLPDSTGKRYQLSDFKNKVIIIDFWFNGCTGCASVARALKPIADAYQDNKDVVFLTVSVDPKRKTWLTGIKSGYYTSTHEINLYTEDLSSGHPFIKYYGYDSFPQLQVIRNGILVSSLPPMPDMNKEGFVACIEKALADLHKTN